MGGIEWHILVYLLDWEGKEKVMELSNKNLKGFEGRVPILSEATVPKAPVYH